MRYWLIRLLLGRQTRLVAVLALRQYQDVVHECLKDKALCPVERLAFEVDCYRTDELIRGLDR